jgi:hypothetical protein
VDTAAADLDEEEARSRWQAMAAEHLADGEVRAAVAELEEFALDAAIAPPWVLPREAEDKLVELGRNGGSLSARSSAIGGPPPPRCQRRVSGRGSRAPCRSQQDPAGGGEEETIAGSPAGTGNLALEHAELVTEGEDLGAESGVGAAADDQDLEQETDGGVGAGAEHDPGASQSPGWGPRRSAQSRGAS